MPVDRSVTLSYSQFSELLGLDPARLHSVEFNRKTSTITVVQEPEEKDDGAVIGHVPAAQ